MTMNWLQIFVKKEMQSVQKQHQQEFTDEEIELRMKNAFKFISWIWIWITTIIALVQQQ
jgi:hypothetical protein